MSVTQDYKITLTLSSKSFFAVKCALMHRQIAILESLSADCADVPFWLPLLNELHQAMREVGDGEMDILIKEYVA